MFDEGRVLVHRDRGRRFEPARRRARRRDPNAPPRRIDARGLTVRNLEFTYRDEQRDIEVLAPQVRTDLAYVARQRGERTVCDRQRLDRALWKASRGGRASRREAPCSTAPTSSSPNVGLKTVEGTIAVNGAIARVLDQPTLDLTLKGTADIERSAIWAPAPVRVAGAASIEGTMKGAPSQFVLDTRVQAPTAEVGHERRRARSTRISRLDAERARRSRRRSFIRRPAARWSRPPKCRLAAIACRGG